LMEVQSKRQTSQHLSITLQDEGQIQKIDEAEAGFRLASVVTSMPSSPKAPRAARAGSAGPRRGARSRAGAAAGKAAARQQPPAGTTPLVQQPAPSPRRLRARVPGWMQVLGAVVALLMLLVLLLMR